MIDIEALSAKELKDLDEEIDLAGAKQGFLPEVIAVLEDLLRCIEPDEVDLSIGGWMTEPPRLYGTLRLYFRDRLSMQASGPVLESLSEIIPVESWKSFDEPASLTRAFSAQIGGPNREVDVNIYWSVADSPDSGCFRRLVRIDRERTELETPVYEIICKEEAPA